MKVHCSEDSVRISEDSDSMKVHSSTDSTDVNALYLTEDEAREILHLTRMENASYERLYHPHLEDAAHELLHNNHVQNTINTYNEIMPASSINESVESVESADSAEELIKSADNFTLEIKNITNRLLNGRTLEEVKREKQMDILKNKSSQEGTGSFDTTDLVLDQELFNNSSLWELLNSSSLWEYIYLIPFIYYIIILILLVLPI